ncbi:hypothetical protein [Streptosporangium sp. NPDC049078]|uniref:hypothetical protein n=1 Tax=Streptosporangium sp. NPDC049078 TaxID=3155767 RepID=UPI003424C55B
MSEPAPGPDAPTTQSRGQEDTPPPAAEPSQVSDRDEHDHQDQDDQDDDERDSHDEYEEDDALASRIRKEKEHLRLRLASLRKLKAGQDTTAGRDWFGGPVNHASDYARVYGAGRDFYNVSSSDGPPVQSAPVTAERLERLKACLVPTESQTQLAKLLVDEPLLLLRGPRNTGRTMTAIAALLEVTQSCHRLMVRGEPIHVDMSHLDKGIGYLLLADESSWTAQLEEVADYLSAVAARRDCRIVVLVGPGYDLPHRVVDHTPPTADQVFRKTFAYLLSDPDAWQAHRLDEHDIVGRLADCQPAEALQLAQQLANGVQRNQTIADVLNAQPLFTRTRFHKHLDKEPTRFGRYFLVSSAVLHGLSEPVVSRAALSLSQQIRDGKEESEDDDTSIWERLGNWLSYSGISTVQGDRRGEGRRLQLRDELAPLLLPMIWEELPAVRDHLYVWLRHLGESTDEHVRIKVAHAVGLLATCDFDLIEREFLDEWSRSTKVRPKQLAAWALEAATSDPEMRDRVHALLRTWSETGPHQRRITAAIAYGSRTGMQNIDEVFKSFRVITLTTKNYWLCDAVARSISDIYGADTARPIAEELAGWARADKFGGWLAAALALARLSPLRHNGARPVLLDHAAEADLIALWTRSLELSLSPDEMAGRGSGLAGQLWQLFTDWVREWEERPSLRPVLEGVFRASRSGTLRLRRTYQLYLLLWQHDQTISAPLFHHLTRILKDG